jgi:HEXXH motif-containing protein
VTHETLERHGVAIQQQSRGVTDALKDWLQSPTTFDVAWHPSFARVHQALHDADANAAAGAIIDTALHVSASLRHASWQAEFTTERRVRWDRWTLPAASAVDVRVGGQTARVFLIARGSRLTYEFSRLRHQWELTRGEADAFPVALRGRQHMLVLTPPSLAGIDWADGEPSDPCELSADEIITSIRRAVALLRRAAAPYWPWVRRVIRGIIPIGGSETVLKSGSSAQRPGLIGVSFPAPPAAIAEMLVHEASHQYFHLLSRLQRPEDGSDATLYYSPIKRTGRPIRAILVAYHAFANVLLFYRLARRHGADAGGYCAREARRLVPQLRELEQPLRTSAALTMTGHALWKPLSARLHL